MTFDNQVQTIYHHLRQGLKIDRAMAFRRWQIADLRSRIAELPKEYGLTPDRERVPGKKYLRYFIESKVKRQRNN